MAIQLPSIAALGRPSDAITIIASGAVAGSVLLSFAAPANATAGLSFSSSGVISDRVDLQQQRVISSAGLGYLTPIEMASRFISDATPPAPGRRVVIRNLTPGFESQPFSDRAYDDALGSEVIRLKSGQDHATQTFTVLPGSLSAPKQNSFSYEIRDNNGTVLESGDFALTVGINDTPITTVYLQRYAGYPSHRYAPHYYDEYAGYGYGGYYGRRRSLFPRSHYRRQLRKYREYRRSRHH